MSKEFAKKLEAPARKSGERAGKAMSSGLDGAIKNLEKQVQASSGKLNDLDRAYEKSVSKREQQQDKLEASTLRLEDAESKYKAAVERGDSGLKELAKVKDEKAKVKKATDDLRNAENDVTAAEKKHKDQLDDLNSTLGKLDAAQDDAADSSREFGDELGRAGADAEEAGGIFDGFVGKIGGVAGALAGVAGAGAFAGLGKEFSSEVGQINRSLGLTGEEAEATGDQVQQALSSGVASGADEAAGSISAIMGQFDNLGQDGEQTAGELSDNFLGFARTFDMDVAEATQMAGQLIQNDFAPDVEAAADLMTGAMQQVPEAMRGEVGDAINEYGVHFQNLGYSGEEAFSMIVGAAEGGQYQIDKTGDALNEFANMAVDPAKAEAFETLGMNADEAASNVAEGGESARKTLEETANNLLAMEDPGQRAATAIELFGAPLEDLSVDQIPAFLENLGGVENTMGDTAGASQELADSIGDSLGGRMDRLQGKVQALAGDAFMWLWDVIEQDIIPAFQDMGQWIQDNRKWLEPLIWIGGSVAGALGGLALATWGYNAAATASSKATQMLSKAFGVLTKHPIIAAISAIVGALLYFFTQTETGRELWEKFTTALGVAWDWVVEKLSIGWQWLRENVFDPLWQFVQETLWPILQQVFTWIGDKWTQLTEIFGVVWGWLRENVFNPLAAFVQETLWPALQTVFGWIGDRWSQMSDLFGRVWNWLRDNVFTPLSNFVTQTLWPALQSAFQWIGDKWQWLSDTFSRVWNWIQTNVFDPFNFAVQYLKNWFQHQIDRVNYWWEWLKFQLQRGWMWIDENVFAPIRGGIQRVKDWFSDRIEDIKGVWQGFQDKLHSVWVWVDENVFAKIGSALGIVQGWFEGGVDNIKSIWDGLKEKLAEPINWVINFVYNDGIKAVFDGVAEKVGLDARLPEIPNIAFAGGGMMPGYTPGRDVHKFYSPTAGILELSGGEPVLRPEAGRVLGKDWVDNVNRVAKTQGESGVEKYLTRSHFADGGFFGGHQALASGGFTNMAGTLSAIQRSHADFVSHFFPDIFNLTSAGRNEPGSYHDFGSMKATDWQNPATYATQMPSAESKALSQAIYKVFPDSAELIHHPLDGWQNLLNGAPHDYGPGTNAGHQNHVHWATNGPAEFDASKSLDDIGVGFSGGAAADPEASWGFWGKILDAVPSFDLPGFGDWAKIPGAALTTMGGWVKDWAVNQLKEWADKFLNFFGVGSGVEQWRDVASEALRRMGYAPEDHIEAMLQQIDIESGGDPQAINDWDSNAAKGTPSGGLLQVIEPTYRDVRNTYPDAFEGLPDDRFHPLTNLTAGVGAVTRDWGGPAGRWPTTAGYADGGMIDLSNLLVRDLGGLVPSGATAVNMSGRDEMMLPPETTALMNQFFAEFPEVAQALTDATVGLENAAEWLSTAADRQSEEGITARQSARRILDLGIDIPGSAIITEILDGEEALWESRTRHLDHLDNLAEKEQALKEARKALADLDAGPESLSEDDQKKLDEAKQSVEEAKAAQAVAASDEERADAANKLAEAEENLTQVRGDLEETTAQNAQQHADDVTAANEEVAQAEQDLIEARKQQVQDLDHIVLVSEDSIMGMIPQVEGLADRIIGMGAPANAVNQGLGAVIGSLTSIAGLAGPAGITLGMAFDAAKVIIGLIQTIVTFIQDLIARIREIHLAAVQAMADGWQVIADYADLVVEMQNNVSTLQQEIVRGLNEQRVAEFELQLATRDRMVAQAEGELAVAEARLDLVDEIERGNIAAQLRLMGLHEDWDSYLSYQALAANGMLTEWSDAAIGALFTYEAARAQALQGELSARLDQINAEADLAAVTRQNTRNQQDLLKAQERLIRMSADVAGVDLVDATATSQVAKLVVEMAELQQQMDSSLLGKLGIGPWGAEQRGRETQMESYRQTLQAIAEETGVTISDAQIGDAISQMQAVQWTDGDPMAVLRSVMPNLVEAETALRINEYMGPIWDAQDARDDLEREVEDLESETDLFEQTQPLEEAIAGLDYTIAGLENAANAWAEGNEDLRAEYLRLARENADAAEGLGVDWQLDDEYATPAVRDQITKEVTINLNGGEMYTADQVDALIAEVISGSNVSATVNKSSSTVAKAKRGVMA